MASVNIFDDMVADIGTSFKQMNLHGIPVYSVLGADCSVLGKRCFMACYVV
jgi:hypothetical protein